MKKIVIAILLTLFATSVTSVDAQHRSSRGHLSGITPETVQIENPSDTVVIGGVSEGVQIKLQSQQIDNHGIVVQTSSASTEPRISYLRSRGTVASPSGVIADDELGILGFYGHDGTNYEKGVILQGLVDGTPGVNDMPGRLEILTTPDGSTTPTLSLTVSDAAGVVLILEGSMQLDEQAAADSFTAGYGQVWVKNTSPAELWYTDDVGSDFNIGAAASGISGSGNTGYIPVFVGAASIGDSVLFESGGKLHLGGTSPDALLHLESGSSGVTSPSSLADELIIENSTSAGLSIFTPNNASGRIVFGDPEDADNGIIAYDHAQRSMDFYTNGAEQMSIDLSGDVRIGGNFSAGSSQFWVRESDAGIGSLDSNADTGVFEDDNDAGISILTGNAGSLTGNIVFGRNGSGLGGISRLKYDHSDDSFHFVSNATIGNEELFSIHTAASNSTIRIPGSALILEQSAADDDVTTYGQLWVKDDTPNELWFTDDAGTDRYISIDSAVTSSTVTIEGTVALSERVAASAFTVGYGQLWVRNDSPAVLVFTDDAGSDFLIGGLGSGAVTGTGTNNQLSKWTGTTSLGDTIIAEISSEIGVNTTTPDSLFDVRDSSGGIVSLTTSEVTVIDGTVLGQLNFVAPEETSGGDGLLAAASVWAEAEAAFSAAANNASLVFATGESEVAVEKMRLTSGGDLELNTGKIKIEEIADADTSVAGQGQIWIKNTSPAELWFTDDADVDTQLTGAGSETDWENPGTIGSTTPNTGEFTTLSAASLASFERAEFINTALENDDHTLKLTVDVDGFSDVKAIDISYITSAVTASEGAGVFFVNIDETASTGGRIAVFGVLATAEGSVEIDALDVGTGIHPIRQISGAFGDADSILNIAVNVLTALSSGGAGNITIFVLDNDTITIGNTVKFEELEIIIDTAASGSGVAPVFEHSTGSGTWASFGPTDGTDGFRTIGVISWLATDIPSWALGTGSEYLIRITRTRNSLSTSPIVDLIQVETGANYSWSADGDLDVNAVTAAGNLDIAGTIEAGSGNTLLTTTVGLLRHQAIDTAIAGANITNTSGVLSVHAESHTVASHSDTTGTGAELTELTDASETTLHSHAGGGGGIGGSGTVGTLPIFVTNTTTIGDSNITVSSGNVTITKADTNTFTIEDSSVDGIAKIAVKNDAQEYQWQLFSDNQLFLTDVTGGTFPMKVLPGAPTSSLIFDVGELIVNSDGTDIDFRVESDISTHGLFLRASDGFIGINNGTPSTWLNVVGTGTGDIAWFQNTAVNLKIGGGSNIAYIDTGAGDALDIRTNGTDAIQISNTQNIVIPDSAVTINEDGGDNDFRVEGNTRTHALFVRGSDGNVGINNSAPDAVLDVISSASLSAGEFTKNSVASTNAVLNVIQDHDGGGVPAVEIQQDDISEGFINFVGSDRGGVPTSTVDSVASVRVEINGTVYVIALHADQ